MSRKGLKTLESPGIRMNPLELQGSLADFDHIIKNSNFKCANEYLDNDCGQIMILMVEI